VHEGLGFRLLLYSGILIAIFGLVSATYKSGKGNGIEKLWLIRAEIEGHQELRALRVLPERNILGCSRIVGSIMWAS
jgi:hypothetical protein